MENMSLLSLRRFRPRCGEVRGFLPCQINNRKARYHIILREFSKILKIFH